MGAEEVELLEIKQEELYDCSTEIINISQSIAFYEDTNLPK